MELILQPIIGGVSHLWACVKRLGSYVYHVETHLRSLRTENNKLIDLRNDVLAKIEVAETQQQLQRTHQVSGWLLRVDELENHANEILQLEDHQQVNNIQTSKCLFCLFPNNCHSSYKFGRRATKLLKRISELKNEGNLMEVASIQLRRFVGERPLGETIVGLDLKFEEAWSYLIDPKVGVLGIVGMGGIGKTTLLCKLNNQLGKVIPRHLDFDVVIWSMVSMIDQNIDDSIVIGKIQDQILKRLGLPDEKWIEKTQDEKAMEIFNILMKKRFVLLLDNIWKRIDLLKIGIPLPTEENGVKVIFTTRDVSICGHMGANKKIKIEPLLWKDAWKLFSSKVGEEIFTSNPDIVHLAEIVAKKCAGLPLALATVGRAMASKETPQEWQHTITLLKKYASHQFSNSTSDEVLSSIESEVLPLLEFSYDNLPNDMIKNCFVYCSLFPEDLPLSVDELIYFWIGEGFFDEFDHNLFEAYAYGSDIVYRLKRACLLIDDGFIGSSCIKMHDMVRNMALWLLSDQRNKKFRYLVQPNMSLNEAPAIFKWEESNRISLMHNRIEELIITPKCFSLLSLNLRWNSLKIVSDGFFEFMHSLRLLDLSRNRNLTQLPTSLFNLVSLQYLDISFTALRDLPFEFKKLTNLKYLYMNYMDQLRFIPRQVLSSLTLLRKFDLYHSGNLDDDDQTMLEGNILSGGNEELLRELEGFRHLERISFAVKSETALNKFLCSQKLQRCTYGLSIELCRGSTSLELSSLLINKYLLWLQINNCNDLQDLGFDWSGNFDKLVSLRIYKCKLLKDLTWVINLPNLRDLKVAKCEAMKEIISDDVIEDGEVQGVENVFSSLQGIWLRELPQLENICSGVLPFPCLRHVWVFDCPKLKRLPFDYNVSDNISTMSIIAGEKAWWDGLQWENDSTMSLYLPYFRKREAPIGTFI